MPLRVYNTLSREKEPFSTVADGKVGIYLCGPTVYKSPHIGHMVGPVIFDAIKRYLTFGGYAVMWVVNITDVDDKLIEKAHKSGATVKEVADKYKAEYHEALKSLGIDTIDRFPKASEHMPEIIAMCETLIAKGNAYATGGNVWFDVASDADYGKLSGRKQDDQEAGGRALEGSGKKNPADFALWKVAKEGEIAWESPWGRGRPGWHIECTAMSIKYLGDTFDIHGGGMDLLFPHHENELAQSECCTGKPFAKYWLHNGLTKIRTKAANGEWKDEKMSGSVGNVVAALDFVKQHGADVLRYLILSSHYRRPIEFTDDAVVVTKKALAVFDRLFERAARMGAPALAASGLAPPPGIASLETKFTETMDDDFNTAGAIGVLHELAGEINGHIERSQVEKTKAPADLAQVAASVAILRRLGQLTGLFLVAPLAPVADDALADGLMQLIISLRVTARKNKDFATADTIRNGLTSLKITLEDRPDGTGWRKG